MNRRSFLTSALAATAAGLLVPEWVLDPPKGRSMVCVPGMPADELYFPRFILREVRAVNVPSGFTAKLQVQGPNGWEDVPPGGSVWPDQTLAVEMAPPTWILSPQGAMRIS